MVLREKSAPISPQSAPYLVLYTLVYISTAVFYSEAFNFLSAKVKEESFNYSRKQILIAKL